MSSGVRVVKCDLLLMLPVVRFTRTKFMRKITRTEFNKGASEALEVKPPSHTRTI